MLLYAWVLYTLTGQSWSAPVFAHAVICRNQVYKPMLKVSCRVWVCRFPRGKCVKLEQLNHVCIGWTWSRWSIRLKLQQHLKSKQLHEYPAAYFGMAAIVHRVDSTAFKAYLPGTEDTLIHQGVLPRRGLSIALRFGWPLRSPQMWATRVRNFC